MSRDKIPYSGIKDSAVRRAIQFANKVLFSVGLPSFEGIGDVDYTDGKVLVANGDEYESATLQHDQVGGVTASQHHAKYTDEEVRDVIGAALEGDSDVLVTVDDVGNTITISSPGVFKGGDAATKVWPTTYNCGDAVDTGYPILYSGGSA